MTTQPTAPILVTGATGKLGRIVTTTLLARGLPVRLFTRRPGTARELFGRGPAVVEGDFADAGALDRALAGVGRVFLLSPIDADLAKHQIAVIEAAERAGADRIVKISGSDWTFGPEGTFSGHAHEAAEKRLFASAIPGVSLRPNAWMQGALASVAERASAGQPIFAGGGEAAVSYFDARDISDVAINRLLAPTIDREVLVLTGSEALTVHDLAAIASRVLGRTIGVATTPPPRPAAGGHVNAFEAGIVEQFLILIRAGRAAPVTDTARRILGRPPRTVEAFLREAIAARQPLAAQPLAAQPLAAQPLAAQPLAATGT